MRYFTIKYCSKTFPENNFYVQSAISFPFLSYHFLYHFKNILLKLLIKVKDFIEPHIFKVSFIVTFLLFKLELFSNLIFRANFEHWIWKNQCWNHKTWKFKKKNLRPKRENFANRSDKASRLRSRFANSNATDFCRAKAKSQNATKKTSFLIFILEKS